MLAAAGGDAATNAASPSALPDMQHTDLHAKLVTYRLTGWVLLRIPSRPPLQCRCVLYAQ